MGDQVTIGAGAVGAQAAEQFHGFQQVGFAFAIGTNHQKPGSVELQAQLGEIAKVQQLQAVQPDGSEAASR
jgi:sorbitol-specific phosphotransferase system component IIA